MQNFLHISLILLFIQKIVPMSFSFRCNAFFSHKKSCVNNSPWLRRTELQNDVYLYGTSIGPNLFESLRTAKQDHLWFLNPTSNCIRRFKSAGVCVFCGHEGLNRFVHYDEQKIHESLRRSGCHNASR